MLCEGCESEVISQPIYLLFNDYKVTLCSIDCLNTFVRYILKSMKIDDESKESLNPIGSIIVYHCKTMFPYQKWDELLENINYLEKIQELPAV